MKYLILVSSVTMLAFGQVLFKLAAKHAPPEDPFGFLTAPVFLFALAVYAGATIAWMFVLRAWPLTVAYPSVALAIVLVLGAGRMFFGEELSYVQVGGAATIILGLLILALG